MTVQDLINELQTIEDKTLPVKTFDEDFGEWLDVVNAEDFSDFVGIN